jgi:hypothetical protein
LGLAQFLFHLMMAGQITNETGEGVFAAGDRHANGEFPWPAG